MDSIQEKLLAEIADLHGIPEGAYNIRSNGGLAGRNTTAHIDIVTKQDKPGINIIIKPGTQNESVHIPVILSEAGYQEMVYNDFYVGENSDVTIIAGCGIHCGSSEAEGHAGIHDFHVGKNARVTYVEKHFAMGEGTGRRVLNPTTKVFLGEGATAEMELTQISGVDEANRINEATLGPDSLMLITERVLTEGVQTASSVNNIILQGNNSRANMISRSVIKGNSKQIFHAMIEALTKCFGHIECDAIIMDNGTNETMPALKALHPDAELTHEASIGKIASDQLTKLMSLGLTYDQAVNRIIQGFLK